VAVKTVILGDRPAELQALINRRHAQGLDLFDEVWEGEYHMAPYAKFRHGQIDQMVAELLGPLARAAGLVPSGPFNLGSPDDFRVPDRGIHRSPTDGAWVSTAAIVVEILSPDDETYDKLPFYARRGVDEVLIFDHDERRVHVLARRGDRYEEIDRSTLLAAGVDALTEHIAWP
jgi:Uma2 family endonuclease